MIGKTLFTGTPTGDVEELLQFTIEQGNVTPAEIAAVLDAEKIPVEYTHDWTVGPDR